MSKTQYNPYIEGVKYTVLRRISGPRKWGGKQQKLEIIA
jgi:hypothetical protein